MMNRTNRKETGFLRIIVLITGLIAIAVSPLPAQVGGQIVGIGAASLVEDPQRVGDVPEAYRAVDDRERFGGLEAEIWFRTVSFGLRYLGRFQSTDGDAALVNDATVPYIYDWRSDLFLGYHLFRGGAFLDPYGRVGGGVAGRQEDGGEIVYIGMYQYVGGGAQVNLGGLVFGVGLDYNVLSQRLDADDGVWGIYPSSRFEARVYGGVAFGR